MHRRLGIVFAIFAGFASAQGATAPSANALAECRLEYSVAQSELKKLKVKQVDDESNLDYDYVSTEYDPAKVRVFGLKATRFLYNLYADEGGTSYAIQTEFALPYDAARVKLLKALAIEKCVTSDKKTVVRQCQLFFKKSDGGRYALLAELKPLATGGSQFECTYLN